MDSKEQDPLWDGDSDYKPLRRPNSNSAVETKVRHLNQEDKVSDSSQSTVESTTNNEDISNVSNSLNDMVVNSKLRVEAKEWFPSSYSPITPQLAQPAQSRLQRIKSVNTIVMNDYNPESSEHKMVFEAVNLDFLIQSLIYDPGQFDNLVDNFIAILEPHFDDVEVAMKTAEMIFEFALREPSFRYNAARLCSVLDEHYPLFRPQLHMLCEKELTTDTQNQGFTLFLAELYVQLHYEAVYGRCVLDSLKKLISSDKPDNIKSACQALKLAGYSLESSNNNALDEIFQDLEMIKLHLQQPLFSLVESVITLRKNNWGRSSNTTVSTNR
ncbi:eif4g domain protein [Holotrichia oblita]|uniref:Eif4g domain protein n=1 Tax=Holotrichia oblita TaxID=644536 RepID=A0ACB9TWS4_HOLOL|nr:eif4g domain protein [Holotrichia oblita]